MKTKSTSQVQRQIAGTRRLSVSAFFNLRVLIGLVVLLTAIFPALFAIANPSRLGYGPSMTGSFQRAPTWASPHIINSMPPLGSVKEEWVARYNGVATAIAIDGSGNVYVTGVSAGLDPDSDSDYATIKYNASGTQEWVARYNGPGNYADGAAAIAVDSSGNVYVTGTSASQTGYDYATVKYDASGAEQWVARYSAGSPEDNGARAIAVDSSGNVYVTGKSVRVDTGYDYTTVKYDVSGKEQWVARYTGPGDRVDSATAIAIDGTGNVYVTGMSAGLGTGYDYATVKYNSSGQQEWVGRYNGPGNSDDFTTGIAVDGAGYVYVTGASPGLGTDLDYATIKYDASGTEQWVARYNGPGSSGGVANAIAVDSSGNVCVTGASVGSGTDFDYATVKYNSAGQQQWVARYNGPANGGDQAFAIAIDGAGNVYVTGQSLGSGTSYDYATVKYDASGTEEWVGRYNGPGSPWDSAVAIAVDGSGNVYVTGTSFVSRTSSAYATIKYSQSLPGTPTPTPTPSPTATATATPTPTASPRPTPTARPSPSGRPRPTPAPR